MTDLLWYIIQKSNQKSPVEAQLDALEISNKRVIGFLGTDLALRPCNPYAYQPDGTPIYIMPEQVAGVLSQLVALRQAVHDGAWEFVIAEEDIVLKEGFAELAKAARHSFPAGIDVVQLEYCCADDKLQTQQSEHVWSCYYPQCGACVWWSRSAAVTAIAHAKIIDSPWDILCSLRVYPFLKHGIIKPMLVSRGAHAN